MMDFLKVTFLSVLQGVAEFLPVSSSGHLAVARHYFGMGDAGLRLDIFLHVGTLFTVVFFYRKTVLRVLAERQWGYILKLIVSAIPVGVAGFLLKGAVSNVSSVKLIGFAFIITGVVLFAGKAIKNSRGEVDFLRSLAMGLAQAAALFPGISRSGMTISVARALGVSPEKSAEFSFFMSIIPIGGAALLDLLGGVSLAGSGGESVSWSLVLWGMAVSFVAGCISLSFLVRIVNSGKFWMFAPYCMFMGALVLILS